MLHGNQRGRHARRAAGALRMPDLRLYADAGIARARSSPSASLSARVSIRSFKSVSKSRAGSRNNIRRRHTGIFHGHLHGPGRFFAALLQPHAMERFAGRAIPGNSP